MNGDDAPDVVVANYSDDSVSVLLNATAPGAATLTFTSQQTFATGKGSYFVAAADLNGDGKADLIVANGSDNTVSVLLNAQYQVLGAGGSAPCHRHHRARLYLRQRIRIGASGNTSRAHGGVDVCTLCEPMGNQESA